LLDGGGASPFHIPGLAAPTPSNGERTHGKSDEKP
jgi:hypothetical protein